MSDEPKQSLAVLRRIAEFLEFLPPEQVDDLADGRARLTLIPWGAKGPLVPAQVKPAKAPRPPRAPSAVDTSVIRVALDNANSREEAMSMLAPHTVGDLRAVAASFGMGGLAKMTKAPLIQQIVEFTVGARLSAAAIRSM